MRSYSSLPIDLRKFSLFYAFLFFCKLFLLIIQEESILWSKDEENRCVHFTFKEKDFILPYEKTIAECLPETLKIKNSSGKDLIPTTLVSHAFESPQNILYISSSSMLLFYYLFFQVIA